MRGRWYPLLLGLTLVATLRAQSPASGAPAPDDPYLWLEDVTGDKALDWVRAENARTAAELEQGKAYKALEDDLLKIMDSKAKIPYVAQNGKYLYNFWRDADHPRGLWRRTTLAEYRKAEPAWETVLDMDALGKAEKKGWVFHGAEFLRPECRLCLVNLSPGGSDAVVVREFDLEKKAFVEGGFQLPLAKTEVAWLDENRILVGTDFGKGSLTTSGYPRVVKLWLRGTPLERAAPVFECQEADMAASAMHDSTRGFERTFLERRPTFFTSELFLMAKDGSKRKLELPADAQPSVHREWLLVQLRTPWTVKGKAYPAGALLATGFDAFMEGGRDFEVLFEPTATTSLEAYHWTRNHLILNVMDDVKNRLAVLTPGKGGWKREPLLGAPAIGNVEAFPVDEEESDDYFMTTKDYLTPDTLWMGSYGRAPEKLKALPAFFDASRLEVTQHFATSKDGTRVPYFQVAPKGMKLDGSHPTLLDGYGGFEVSSLPRYSGIVGRAWLEQGRVFVVANIRGGGEYGPRWHQAALKQNRHRAYEDFAAVAEDLVRRKVTTEKRLGIIGGSNGGLLVGNMLVQYPSLMGAVVCQVPLLDMKRYSHLLAGASWMEEYGDPDKPEEWAFLRTFSPYQLVKPGQKYPPTFFMTTTRDDRVHPAHARKMYARMKEMGYDVRYFENIEGGHGAGADNRQSAHFWALAYTFLDKTLH